MRLEQFINQADAIITAGLEIINKYFSLPLIKREAKKSKASHTVIPSQNTKKTKVEKHLKGSPHNETRIYNHARR